MSKQQCKQLHHRRIDFVVQSMCLAQWVGGPSMVLLNGCVRAGVRNMLCGTVSYCATGRGFCTTGQLETAQRNASFPSLYKPRPTAHTRLPARPPPFPVPVSGCHNYATRGGQLRRRGDRLRWEHVVPRRRTGETLNKAGNPLPRVTNEQAWSRWDFRGEEIDAKQRQSLEANASRWRR